jgi:replicative DNA helicase
MAIDTSTNAKVTPLRADSDVAAARLREPPHNFDAEQALLGAVLVNNLAYGRVSEFLQPGHFAHAAHGRIFEACSKLIEKGQIANPLTLKNLFDQDSELEAIGGAQYLARLAASATTIINAADYGRIIFDLHLRRQLIDIGETVVNEAFDHDPEGNASTQIEAAEQRLFDLATTGQSDSGFQAFNDVLTKAVDMAEAAYKREGSLTGVSTGFTALDKLLGGLQPSDLVILAARPSMGKTALATNIAYNAARAYQRALEDGRYETDAAGRKKVLDGAVVGFFSLEMAAEQLATRMLAETAEVDSDKIRKGELTTEDFNKVVQASRALSRMPFFIDDTPALSVSALRTRARRLQRQHGLSMIVIDYLQLARPTVGGRAQENRVQEISDITRGLKALAKELNVPVIALSQLSRAVEQREDKRPQLADLRESGSIEQDADVVMFIYRAEYYLSRLEPDPGTEKHQQWLEDMDRVHNLAEVIIGKQRHGPTGTVQLQFEGRFTKFSNFVSDDHLPNGSF